MPGLEPDQIVDVSLAGGWRKTVRVTGAGASHVDVLPIDGPAGLPGGVDLWEATIEWRAARGLARLEGVIADTKAGLRFLKTTEEVVMQRRRFFRVRCGVRVTLAGGARDALLTEVVDVRPSRAVVRGADRLAGATAGLLRRRDRAPGAQRSACARIMSSGALTLSTASGSSHSTWATPSDSTTSIARAPGSNCSRPCSALRV